MSPNSFWNIFLVIVYKSIFSVGWVLLISGLFFGFMLPRRYQKSLILYGILFLVVGIIIGIMMDDFYVRKKYNRP